MSFRKLISPKGSFLRRISRCSGKSIGSSICETLLFVKQVILRESLTVVEFDDRALEHELSIHPQLHRVTVVYLHQRHLVAVLL